MEESAPRAVGRGTDGSSQADSGGNPIWGALASTSTPAAFSHDIASSERPGMEVNGGWALRSRGGSVPDPECTESRRTAAHPKVSGGDSRSLAENRGQGPVGSRGWTGSARDDGGASNAADTASAGSETEISVMEDSSTTSDADSLIGAQLHGEGPRRPGGVAASTTVGAGSRTSSGVDGGAMWRARWEEAGVDVQGSGTNSDDDSVAAAAREAAPSPLGPVEENAGSRNDDDSALAAREAASSPQGPAEEAVSSGDDSVAAAVREAAPSPDEEAVDSEDDDDSMALAAREAAPSPLGPAEEATGSGDYSVAAAAREASPSPGDEATRRGGYRVAAVAWEAALAPADEPMSSQEYRVAASAPARRQGLDTEAAWGHAPRRPAQRRPAPRLGEAPLHTVRGSSQLAQLAFQDDAPPFRPMPVRQRRRRVGGSATEPAELSHAVSACPHRQPATATLTRPLPPTQRLFAFARYLGIGRGEEELLWIAEEAAFASVPRTFQAPQPLPVPHTRSPCRLSSWVAGRPGPRGAHRLLVRRGRAGTATARAPARPLLPPPRAPPPRRVTPPRPAGARVRQRVRAPRCVQPHSAGRPAPHLAPGAGQGRQ